MSPNPIGRSARSTVETLERRLLLHAEFGAFINFQPPDAPVPEECCLVIRSGEIVGRVTSAARSAAVGSTVGLAYVHPNDAEPGSRFTVKLEDGLTVTPTVVPLPFYDPRNARQEL